jgi:hypothetical protein
MAGKFGAIEVEGLKEFQRAVRFAADTGLTKELGQANKKIGQLVVDRLSPRPDPAAVGTGAGATVRPSATRREVLLRVGGKHREGRTPIMQWGRRPGPSPFGRRPKRPYIRWTVERHRQEIEREWLKAVAKAMKPAFYRTEP